MSSSRQTIPSLTSSPPEPIPGDDEAYAREFARAFAQQIQAHARAENRPLGAGAYAYIAGPMRGVPFFNYPLFNAVAARLRSMGWSVYNPAETDAKVQERAEASKNPLRVYMQQDLADVACSDYVFVLPGWQKSEGARIEVVTAFQLGIPVLDLPRFEKVERPVLGEWAYGAYEVKMKIANGGERKKKVVITNITPRETLPVSSEERKEIPLTTGVLDYFPAALAEVAKVSKQGNDKHNPGEPLHWARGKSMDQADCIGRHLLERGGVDPDTGMRHSAQLAWRALALLQLELEEAGEAPLARAATLDDEKEAS